MPARWMELVDYVGFFSSDGGELREVKMSCAQMERRVASDSEYVQLDLKACLLSYQSD